MHIVPKLPMNALCSFTLCFASLASAQLSQVDEKAFACKVSTECIYFDEYKQQSAAFRNALASAIKESRVRINKKVYGVVTPMLPVRIDGKEALIGMTCQPHYCPHQLNVIFYRNSMKVVALYSGEFDYLIGYPSPAAGKALLAGANEVGESFR